MLDEVKGDEDSGKPVRGATCHAEYLQLQESEPAMKQINMQRPKVGASSYI